MAMAVRSLPEWQQTLRQTFTHILQTRMQGIPVIHPLLQVNADNFVCWQGWYLGVLVTPWFMNLMLLPATDDAVETLATLRIGNKQTHCFPSGSYEFMVGAEEGIGRYLSCSLFSPMYQFQDQAAVLDTATAVLAELMNFDNLELLDAGGNPLVTDAGPTVEASDAAAGDPPGAGQSVSELSGPELSGSEPRGAQRAAAPRPLSRRQLFTGRRS